jgi:drug/metabolite transporter (DMT)-like permease
MYVAYTHAYRFLASHQVVLFTVLTPLYVTLINDIQLRRFHGRFLLTAALAVVGGGAIVVTGQDLAGVLPGFVLMQLSNLSFALGQVWYRRVMGSAGRIPSAEQPPSGAPTDVQVFALLYLGGSLVAAVPAAIGVEWEAVQLSAEQVVTLLYLGIVPSGVCFCLWNVGARRCNAGVLAVFNNAKIPLAVLISLACFGETADVPRLIAGGAVILLGLLLSRNVKPRP